MRFEEAASSLTVLKYCTDGVLLAEATHNNRLGQYGVIILDEVHERSLTMDVLMGLVKVRYFA
jgi:HrpA-like RNA helicase